MKKRVDLGEMRHGTELLKRGFAKMQEGGVVMDVVTAEQAHVAEDSGVESRIDEDKFLHLRIDLAALSRGKGEVTLDRETMVAKGRFKLEVYPGQSAYEVARSIFEGLISK